MKALALFAAVFALSGCAPKVELTDEQFERITDRLDAIEAKQDEIIASIEDVQNDVTSIDCSN